MASSIGNFKLDIGSIVKELNTIHTGAGNDNVEINKASGLAGLFGMYDVSINGKHQLMTKQELESKTFDLGAGNDRFVVGEGVNANVTVRGGEGDDMIIGGNGNDNLRGEGGNDLIIGGNGNDVVDGGKGNDSLQGGNGNDTIWGGEGNDVMDGGYGSDFLVGGQGSDVMSEPFSFFDRDTHIQGDLFSILASVTGPIKG